MRKNVMLVSKSTVALRSCSFSGMEAWKLLRYMEMSMRSELCSVSSSRMNLSLPKLEAEKRSLADTLFVAGVCA